MNNKSVLYVIPTADFTSPSSSLGVYKKIIAQCAAFARLGYTPTLLCYENGSAVFKRHDRQIATYKISSLMWKLGNYSHILQEYFKGNKGNYDLIYVRMGRETPFSLKAAKVFRKCSKRIVYEIPTYPYDSELLGIMKRHSFLRKIRSLISICLDRVCRSLLKKYIDCFAVMTDLDDVKEVFGAPAVKITNGIDVGSVPVRNRIPEETIALIGVASVNYWHGYDRIICGLGEYYASGKTRNVVFYLVGDGPDLSKLKRLTQDFGLEQRVIFHGTRVGKELDDLFDRADIGVGSLGLHRKGFQASAELKAREYCARQIPFIGAGDDVDFTTDFKWRLQIDASDAPVDIEEMLAFHENCIACASEIAEMRKFAVEHLSWETQLMKILG